MRPITYQEKLTDPRCQKKRLEVFERDNWQCQSCGRADKSLHIHHLKYLVGCDPWDYDNSFLITYCSVCHETEHLIGGQINETFIEIIRAHPPLLKPLSQLCILSERFPPFREKLQKFLNGELIIYQQEMKNRTNEATSVSVLPG